MQARRPRKLLFYLYALGSGGAERVVALLASGFANRGDDVTLVVQVEARENMPFVAPTVRLRTIGADHGRAVWRLATILRQEKPDVSISALALCNLKHSLAAGLAGRRQHAVLSVHGHIDAEPQRTSRLANRLSPVLTRVTARTVCVSDWMRDHVVRDLGGSARRCVTIHNPVSLDNAVPAASIAALLARPPVVLGMGRFVLTKDFSGLLQAFAAVDVPDARLVILGDGPERAPLEAKAKALGIAERVSMPGYVSEPWAFFREARVAVVSSVSESFSNVALEALAHGLPVVATDCGGPREILANSELGTLVPIEDPTALGRALTGALRDPGDPGPRVKRAKEFSLPATLAAYDALFDAVIEEAG